jgi:hypothetical protein
VCGCLSVSVCTLCLCFCVCVCVCACVRACTLNVTPDSFSDGNKFLDPAAAVGRMLALEAAGVDVIDIGQYSQKSSIC